MPKKVDEESGKYSQVDQEEGALPSSKRMSFSFSKKPAREAAADHDATKKTKEKVAPPPVSLIKNNHYYYF